MIAQQHSTNTNAKFQPKSTTEGFHIMKLISRRTKFVAQSTGGRVQLFECVGYVRLVPETWDRTHVWVVVGWYNGHLVYSTTVHDS